MFLSSGGQSNNPLVVKRGMPIEEAKVLDKYGKGGGLVDGELIREFPVAQNSANRDAAYRIFAAIKRQLIRLNQSLTCPGLTTPLALFAVITDGNVMLVVSGGAY